MYLLIQKLHNCYFLSSKTHNYFLIINIMRVFIQSQLFIISSHLACKSIILKYVICFIYFLIINFMRVFI
jgi:hypothetical protein